MFRTVAERTCADVLITARSWPFSIATYAKQFEAHVAVRVAVDVGVALAVWLEVEVLVLVAVAVGVALAVWLEVEVLVLVAVAVEVEVSVAVSVSVSVNVSVAAKADEPASPRPIARTWISFLIPTSSRELRPDEHVALAERHCVRHLRV
jgi:hypothetical protein